MFCVLADGQYVGFFPIIFVSNRLFINLVVIIRVHLFNLNLIFKELTLFFFNSLQTPLDVDRQEGT